MSRTRQKTTDQGPATPTATAGAPPAAPGEGEDPLAEFFISADERNLAAHGSGAAARGGAVALSELLAFWVADEEYAVPIVEVQEIIKVPTITSVPRVAPAVLGITSLRGTIVPVVDLRQLLGLEAAAPTRAARILVVRGDDDPVGFLVDRVSSVVRLGAEAIEPVPRTMQREALQLLAGVGKEGERMLILLELAAVLAAVEQS